MTSERKKGEFRKGDVFYLDRHFKMKDIEAAIATKVYAQALADVDAAAEKLAPIGHQVTFEQFGDGWMLYDPVTLAPTLTQAILSTGGE